jgi:chorismate synthase
MPTLPEYRRPVRTTVATFSSARALARRRRASLRAGSRERSCENSGVTVASFVLSIGDVSVDMPDEPAAVDPGAVESSEVRCHDAEASSRMMAAIDRARADGESLGGTFCVTASGLVPGLGTYAEASRRLDARIAAAVMSIPAIKGIEIGDGFAGAALPGSRVHDEIAYDDARGFYRRTNRAGGLEGGMTNGEPLWLRAAMKPIPTLMRPLGSVDIDTHEPVDASKERSDVCAVPAAAVVAEAEVALVLADAYLEKFGSDCMEDIASALEAYKARISG